VPPEPYVGVNVGGVYTNVLEWFGPPGRPEPPPNPGGVFTDNATRREPPIFARKFSSPGISSTRSYYLLFEGNYPFEVSEWQFLDFFDRVP
jgi:hypothetical protein